MDPGSNPVSDDTLSDIGQYRKGHKSRTNHGRGVGDASLESPFAGEESE